MPVDDRGDTDPATDDIAAAEAQAAEAEARARAARARAAEARRKAESQAESPHDADGASRPLTTGRPFTGRTTRRRTGRTVAAAALGVALLCGLLGISGYILADHRASEQERQRTAQFSAAARQGVVNLMAINYNTAQADVQRVLDNATGQFKDNFAATSKDLVKALQDAKIVTEIDVKGVAVESMTGESAAVLVSAVSQRGDADAANRDPRTWRAMVTVDRDGDQLKISKLEFV